MSERDMAPVGPWDEGRVRIGYGGAGGQTRLVRLAQRQPLRAFFPDVPAGEPPQAVIGNTSGGIVGGDHLAIDVATEDGARALITTQAAEKVYRSAGPEARLEVRLEAAPGSVLEWLPHETILFDRLRFRRRLALEAARDARVLLGEMVVFGRTAHGESLRQGCFHDFWSIGREGRPLWADALRLEGDLTRPLGARFGFAGARALATFLYVAEDARDHLVWLRDRSFDQDLRVGVTAFDRILLVRILGRDGTAVRAAAHRLLPEMRARLLGHPARLPATFAS